MKSSLREYHQINSQKKVLVIGSAVIDVILNVNSIPSSGSDEFAHSEKTIVGGCAYNVGDILSQFKANYDLMVPVGDGLNGTIIENKLKKEGKTSLLNNILGDNGWTLCIVENNGERTFLTIPGVEMTWKKNWFKEIDLNKYDYIYVSGYSFEPPSDEVLLEEFSRLNEKTTIIFDPSPRINKMNCESIRKLLEINTIVHANEDEILQLSSENHVKDAALEVSKQTNQPVIVTLGNEGTLIANKCKVKILEGEKVPVTDTIGAGDSHTAAFIAGLLDNQSIEKACIWGNEVASKIVQERGGNTDIFNPIDKEY